LFGLPHDARTDPLTQIVENRLVRTARLSPGEPLAEVSQLAMLYDAEVDAYCL
jgi:hypothetical protein